jgi:hypothetical protein
MVSVSDVFSFLDVYFLRPFLFFPFSLTVHIERYVPPASVEERSVERSQSGKGKKAKQRQRKDRVESEQNVDAFRETEGNLGQLDETNGRRTHRKPTIRTRRFTRSSFLQTRL